VRHSSGVTDHGSVGTRHPASNPLRLKLKSLAMARWLVKGLAK
jgi:hypothetical protein